MKMAAAVACAPLIPSGWLCVIAAEIAATLSVSSSVLKNQPTALTLIADPLPHEPYGWRPVEDTYGIPPFSYGCRAAGWNSQQRNPPPQRRDQPPDECCKYRRTKQITGNQGITIFVDFHSGNQIRLNATRYRTPAGMANSVESNRSSMPPWPGMIFPESFRS